MIIDEVKKYAENCINNKIVSCQKHRWACERFLKDIKRVTDDKKFDYYWDEYEANQIIKWFRYLKHTKGVLAGQPIVLTIWQKFLMCQLYGWRENETGYKRFKNFFIEVARKNAKSQLQAGLTLYECAIQSVKNGEIYEIYTAGVKKDQSKIIIQEATNMLEGSPLKSYFKITTNRITHIKTNSFIAPLSKDDGKKGDGTNPAVIVLDEYHQHKTTEFYDLGQGTNVKEGLMGIITTAGNDLNSPCYTQEYPFCSKLLDPKSKVKNDRYLADIMELDKGDDFRNFKYWLKANPIRASYKKGLQDLKERYDLAIEMPEKLIAFKTKCLNEWVQGSKARYMDIKKWRECLVDKINIDVTGRSVYIGFDMSSKIDLTSLAFIIPIGDDKTKKYILYSHSFIANETYLRQKIETDKQPYDLWVNNGYITMTNTPVIDQNQVLEYMEEFVLKHKLKVHCLCFDSHNSSQLMLDCVDKGYISEEVYQSVKSLNEATKTFRDNIYEKKIIIENNPVLNYSVIETVIKTDSNGLIKIDKSKSNVRIDPIDSALCAFKLAMYHKFGIGANVDKMLDDMDLFM